MTTFLLELMRGLRIRDAVDVVVVAYLIYYGLTLLKGSRALRVFGGLLVLGALYAAGRLLELTTLTWIMERFSFYAVLAMVVLFQEDIRRALAQVGNPLFGGLRRHENLPTYQQIARACFRLADQGHGALIAVERDASLEERGEQATVLDAELSEGLLVALFQPESPIHDGAVIVRKDRVWVAGAFFPLTSRADLPRELGTRHRAALGQTEQTDSLVFLVSEERRLVSIAFRGELHTVDSPDELRLKVNELLLTETKPEEPIRMGMTGSFAPTRGLAASLPPRAPDDSADEQGDS